MAIPSNRLMTAKRGGTVNGEVWNPQASGGAFSAGNANHVNNPHGHLGKQSTQPAGYGMFNTHSTTDEYHPTNAPEGVSYDFSGMQAGIDSLKSFDPSTGFKKLGGYQPYQFKKPSMSTLGDYGQSTVNPLEDYGASEVSGLGDYGTDSDIDFSNVQNSVMNSASRPLIAASNERMRTLGQGFNGLNMDSGVMSELAMKNAQQLGSDLQDTSANISSTIANRRLGQMETARAANRQDAGDVRNMNLDQQNQRRAMNYGDQATTRELNLDQANQARQAQWQDRGDVRNKLFQNDIDTQNSQAGENYKGWQSKEEQQQAMVDAALKRSGMFFDEGYKIPQLQGSLNDMYDQQYYNLLGGFEQLSGPQG